jgi:hypothetical protein
MHRAYENTLTIDGAGPEGEVEIDLVTRSVGGGGWRLVLVRILPQQPPPA